MQCEQSKKEHGSVSASGTREYRNWTGLSLLRRFGVGVGPAGGAEELTASSAGETVTGGT